jgi:hypothetical protein
LKEENKKQTYKNLHGAQTTSIVIWACFFSVIVVAIVVSSRLSVLVGGLPQLSGVVACSHMVVSELTCNKVGEINKTKQDMNLPGAERKINVVWAC